MTDTRLPERFLTDRRLLLLDVAHRWSYVASLAWSVANRTDGVILPEELDLIPDFASGSPTALLDARLWKPLPKGWAIIDFASTQTSAHELSVLENVRRNNREAQARKRAERASDKPPPPPSQRDSQPDVSMTGQSDSPGRKEGQEGRLGKEVLGVPTLEREEQPEPEPAPEILEEVQPDATVSPFRRRYTA
jgi:hypothetical protein